MRRPPAATLVALLVLVSVAAGVAAGGPGEARPAQTTPATNGSVGAGDRLQGIVGVQAGEVEGELAARRFAVAFAAAGSNASRAGVIAEQAGDLRERLAAARDRKRALRRARENGSITRGEFAAEMAALASRIAAAKRLANRTEAATRRVPAAALRERGIDAGAIRELRRNASSLAGPEVAAIARSIAGRDAGRAVAAGNRPNVTGPPRDRPGGGRPAAANGSGGPPNAANGSGGPAGTARPGADRAFGAGTPPVGELAAPSPVAGNVAQTDPANRPLFEVLLREDGSARVVLVLTFNLSTDEARKAFTTLREDEGARANVRERFGRRMESVANRSERVTGREMRVSDPGIRLEEAGGTGIIMLSVGWDGLAAVEDRHLVITEPFASGFTPDREFRVRITGPGGYRVTTARPAPDDRGETSAAWAPGADLSGYTLVFSPAERTPLPETVIEGYQSSGTARTTSETGTGAPGFGAGAAVLAVLAAALAAARRD